MCGIGLGMAGMLALEVNGSETVYMSEDGRFIMIGKLLELKDGEVVNPAEQRLEKVRAEGIKELNKDDMIRARAEQHGKKNTKATEETGTELLMAAVASGFQKLSNSIASSGQHKGGKGKGGNRSSPK